MSKIVKNTTISAIALSAVGHEIPASDQLVINAGDLLLWSSVDSIVEITPYINSGDIVINDGVNDLLAARGIDYLKYPDRAFNQRFESEPERSNGLTAKNTQEAIEEVKDDLDVSASPGFTWGASGNATNNTWLLNDSVPSNKSGRSIFVIGATLEAVFVRCELASTFDIEVYEHDGTTFTLITTVNITGTRGGDFLIGSESLTTGKELALKLVNGSAKNPVAGCIIKGST